MWIFCYMSSVVKAYILCWFGTVPKYFSISHAYFLLILIFYLIQKHFRNSRATWKHTRASNSKILLDQGLYLIFAIKKKKKVGGKYVFVLAALYSPSIFNTGLKKNPQLGFLTVAFSVHFHRYVASCGIKRVYDRAFF